MKRLIILLLSFAVLAPPVTAKAASTPAEQRAAIDKMEADTLKRLYAANPDAEREIANSVGYAVFSTGELAVFWISGGYGHGIAHNNTNGNNIYMQMAKAGLGIGLGAKDSNTVFVFHDPKAFTDFTTTGLDLSGQADAAVKSGVKGDAIGGQADVLPGVRIYQLTDTGLLAQAMVQGTKYWRDDTLN